MTAVIIPDMQRRLAVQAADRAYEALRWDLGDSYEMASALRRLAHECWLAGYEQGLQSRPEAPE